MWKSNRGRLDGKYCAHDVVRNTCLCFSKDLSVTFVRNSQSLLRTKVLTRARNIIFFKHKSTANRRYDRDFKVVAVGWFGGQLKACSSYLKLNFHRCVGQLRLYHRLLRRRISVVSSLTSACVWRGRRLRARRAQRRTSRRTVVVQRIGRRRTLLSTLDQSEHELNLTGWSGART